MIRIALLALGLLVLALPSSANLLQMPVSAAAPAPAAYLIPGFGVIDNQTGTTARLLPGFGVIRIE